MIRIFTYALLLLSTLSFAGANYRVEVPIERKVALTLIDLITKNQDSLGDSILFEHFKTVPTDTISESSVSCWLWVYRQQEKPSSNKENRLECRWAYGANTGLGVFSWRFPTAIVSAMPGASESLSFVIQGDDILPLAKVLQNELNSKDGADRLLRSPQDGKERIIVAQENTRYPELSCVVSEKSCQLKFFSWESFAMDFSLGAASLPLVKVMLSNETLSGHLSVDGAAGDLASAQNVESADCRYQGDSPEWGQFAIHSANQIECSVTAKLGPDFIARLDMNNMMTQRFGNRFTGSKAVQVNGSITELLYKALRREAEESNSSLFLIDDTSIVARHRGVSLRRYNDKEEYPATSVECFHEIYDDAYTRLYKKYFPDTYIGRIEYYKCRFTTEKVKKK